MDDLIAENSFKNITVSPIEIRDNKDLLMGIKILSKETFDSIGIF
jgi:hypothetical protein